MPRHIAFFNVPAVGHVNPTLAVVAELVRRGHRVTYTTVDSRAPVVAATGATALTYRSSRPDDSATGLPLPRRSGYISQTMLNFLREAEAVLDQRASTYRDDPPDLVVYDRIAFAGRIVAAQAGLPTVQLWPMLVSNEHWAMGSVDPADPVFLEYRTRLVDLLARQGVRTDPDEFLAPPSARDIAFYPKAFQYRGELFDDRYCFVGPCIRASKEFPRWLPPTGDRPMLLVTLGTIYNEQPAFYRTVVSAFGGTEWRVVIAVGQRVSPDCLGVVPDNIEVHQVIPQLEVLAHSTVLLSHGGVGGIMEAARYGVPAVVAPQTLEQEANAARVEELGLGAWLRPDNLTPAALRDAVEQVAKDESVALQVHRMRREIYAAGGAVRAADVIEAALS